MAWLLHQPAVTAPIVGPRTMEQFEGAPARRWSVTLDDDALARLDEIFPGYKAAPRWSTPGEGSADRPRGHRLVRATQPPGSKT